MSTEVNRSQLHESTKCPAITAVRKDLCAPVTGVSTGVLSHEPSYHVPLIDIPRARSSLRAMSNSTSDWSPDNLSEIGQICFDVFETIDDFPAEIKPLLIKFRTLGQQLESLSRVLKTSGRSDRSYYDPDLEEDIHKAKNALEDHLDGLSQLRAGKKLNTKKINRINQHIDDHYTRAKEFQNEIFL